MVLTRSMEKKIHDTLQEISSRTNFEHIDFFSVSVNGHAVDDHTETFLLQPCIGMKYVREIEMYLKNHPLLAHKFMMMKWDLVPLAKSINNVYLNCFRC